jgi:hypothetical protein
MNPARPRIAGRASIGAGLFTLTLATGCVPKTSLRQTDVMQQTGVMMSAVELRARINQLGDRMAGRLGVTADRIAAETKDPKIRRRAIAFKADAIPALYTAAFRADPLIAAVDVWALAFQIDQALEDGAFRDAFGPQQAIARAGAQALVGDADAEIRTIAVRPEAYSRARARFENWARENPVEYAFSARASAATQMTKLRDEERDAFTAVGAASDTLENLSERLNIYLNLVPREVRWQAEMLVSDLEAQYEIKDTLGDVRAVTRRADDLLRQFPDLLSESGPIRDMVAAERRVVLDSVDYERRQTLEYMTGERLTILTAMREERVAALDAISRERVATLQEAEAMRKRAWEEAMRDTRRLVNETVLHVAVVTLVLMTAAAMLGVVTYRLTLGSRARPTGP